MDGTELNKDIERDEKLEACIRNMTASEDPCHDYSHSLRVFQTALQISQVEGGSPQILYLGALLHDIGRTCNDSNHPHNERGVPLAEEMLSELAYPTDTIQKVKEVVLAHSTGYDHPREKIECRIIHDSDNLDAMGAIGLARTFSTAGTHGIPLYRYSSEVCRSMLDDRIDALNRWLSSIHSETARQIGGRRYSFELQFLETLVVAH